MKNMRTRGYLIIGLFLFLFTGFKEIHEKAPAYLSDIGKEDFTVERIFDKQSATYYYQTHIKHRDEKGKLIKLRHAHSNKENGETVREFAKRINCTLAFNASTQRKVDPGVRKPSGVQIIEGKIIQDISSTAYTLGIKDNNELLAYKLDISAAAILKDGVNNALTAFGPLIEDHQPAPGDALAVRKNYAVKHPRQVIAQLDNLDLVFLSCGGRGFDGEGMTAGDLTRILQELNVRFAFMLDGGGSTSTVVNGELITKKIDNNGTEERLRPNFLYIK